MAKRKTTWKTLMDEDWLDDIKNNLVWFKYEEQEKHKTLDFLLNRKFDNGYGSREGLSFIIITKEWIYFPTIYDGAEDAERIPRNPNANYEPIHFGGW